MKNLVSTLLLALAACGSSSSPAHALSPSPDPKDQAANAALARAACPDASRPVLAIGRVEIACCTDADVWYPQKCEGKRPLARDHADDNFCRQTPIGGTLYVNRAGTWWCCGGGQCGN